MDLALRLPVAALAVSAAVLAPAESPGVTFSLSPVAVTGDSAPGTTGTYTAFDLDLPSLNQAPTVVFSAFVTGTVSAGVFKYPASGPGAAVSLEGDSAPNTGPAGVYTQFTPIHINDSGLVAFRAGVKSGNTPVGIFTDSAGLDKKIAAVGDPFPGTAGSYTDVRIGTLANTSDVAFHAVDMGASVGEAIVLDSGTDVAIASQGDATPAGGTYASFSGAAINGTNAISFSAAVSGGSATSGLFLSSGVALSLQGDPAPGTGGGSFGVLSIGRLGMNDSGDVAFSATVSSGTATAGVFTSPGGVDAPIAIQGDPAPGTGSGTFDQPSLPAINEAGDVAWRTSLSGGSAAEGIFYYEASSGDIAPVVLVGDPVPGLTGVVFSTLGDQPGLNDQGEIAFGADFSNGDQGVFLATPGPDPPPPPVAICTETRITTNLANQYDPEISGDKIVYTDERNLGITGTDIWIYDLATGMESSLIGEPGFQSLQAIDGDIVVWTDTRNDPGDIFMFDLATSVETPIPNPGVQRNPSVSGGVIVWEDSLAGIFAYDIASSATIPISASGMRPDTDGTWVVWLDAGDVWSHNLITTMTTQVTMDAALQAQVSVDGGRVVYDDNRNIDWEIYMTDLASSIETRITTDPMSQRSPKISGDLIVWEVNIPFNNDLHGHDLATGTEFVVTAAPDSQFLQDVDGRNVVYTDDRFSQLDIFLCEIPTATPAGPSLSPGIAALLCLLLAASGAAYARRAIREVAS